MTNRLTLARINELAQRGRITREVADELLSVRTVSYDVPWKIRHDVRVGLDKIPTVTWSEHRRWLTSTFVVRGQLLDHIGLVELFDMYNDGR